MVERSLFEWPRACLGWRCGDVRAMLADLEAQVFPGQLHKVFVDGCSTGLSDSQGNLLMKPWTIFTTSRPLAVVLTPLRCSGDHPHVPCHGRRTALSARYTMAMAKVILDALKSNSPRHFVARGERGGHVNNDLQPLPESDRSLFIIV